MWLIFSSALRFPGPQQPGCCFLWPDSYLSSLSFCLHLSSRLLLHLRLQPPSIPPRVICRPPPPLFITGPQTCLTGLAQGRVILELTAGVCLRCDLCTTVRSGDQKAAACWLSVDLCSNSSTRDVVFKVSYFLATVSDYIHKRNSVTSPNPPFWWLWRGCFFTQSIALLLHWCFVNLIMDGWKVEIRKITIFMTSSSSSNNWN